MLPSRIGTDSQWAALTGLWPCPARSVSVEWRVNRVQNQACAVFVLLAGLLGVIGVLMLVSLLLPNLALFASVSDRCVESGCALLGAAVACGVAAFECTRIASRPYLFEAV